MATIRDMQQRAKRIEQQLANPRNQPLRMLSYEEQEYGWSHQNPDGTRESITWGPWAGPRGRVRVIIDLLEDATHDAIARGLTPATLDPTNPADATLLRLRQEYDQIMSRRPQPIASDATTPTTEED